MYRIQADADAGRIKGAIRLIMNKKKGYKMECLLDGDECLRDSDKVDKKAFDHFKKWFERTDEEKNEGEEFDRIIRSGRFDEFRIKTKGMGVNEKANERVWKGMEKKK